MVVYFFDRKVMYVSLHVSSAHPTVPHPTPPLSLPRAVFRRAAGQLQVELLKCLKASLNNQLGIDFLAARPEVVGILALNFGSEDVFICTQVMGEEHQKL